MPSPFPGMDPYLEDREIWSGVHARLIADIQEVLNRSLRPKYVVRVEERVYVSDEEDPGRVLFVPDAQVLLGRKRLKEAPATIATPAPASVITAPRPVEVAELLDEEVRERYLTVARVEGRRVVTIIELLSPTNKVPGSRGRRSYLRKRRKTLRSGPQLVELDLLRQGEPPLPRDGRRRRSPGSRS